MIIVYQVKPASSGFGMFDRGVEGVRYAEMDSVSDYINDVLSNTALECVRIGDDDAETLADADGRIHGQGDGVLIGWKGRDGSIGMELVYED